MTDDLTRIQDAITNNETERARDMLREQLRNPSADIYFLASLVALNTAQQAQHLQKALELDPFHQEAVDAWASSRSTQQPVQTQAQIDEAVPPASAKKRDMLEAPARSGYDWRRLVPLATAGAVIGGFMTATLGAGLSGDGVLYANVAYSVSILIAVALCIHHWRSHLKRKRWLYQLEIEVLFLSAALSCLVVRVLRYPDQEILIYVASGWTIFGIIAGNILLFAKTPEDAKSE